MRAVNTRGFRKFNETLCGSLERHRSKTLEGFGWDEVGVGGAGGALDDSALRFGE